MRLGSTGSEVPVAPWPLGIAVWSVEAAEEAAAQERVASMNVWKPVAAGLVAAQEEPVGHNYFAKVV